MDFFDVQPLRAPFRKTITVPGSKSITNRALPLAALAAPAAGSGHSHQRSAETTLTGVLFADDTWQMINALQTLGYSLALDQKAREIRILGRGSDIPPGTTSSNAPPPLHCGNSGTTIRFLAAMLTLGRGEYILDGVPRMRERPIDQLVDQLRSLGAEIRYDLQQGFPPIHIHAAGLAGGGCQFRDAKSSQYISAVLMAAPYARNPVTVSLLGPVTSEPYVVMTLRMMEQFGVTAAIHDQCGEITSRAIQIMAGQYRPPESGHYAIEPDASNASYFLAAAAIVPGSSATIAGLTKGSLQGDVAFADVLSKMGARVEWSPAGGGGVTVSAPPPESGLTGVDLDLNHIPDMVQTLCVAALFAQGTTRVRNVWNLRVKETDRLAALENELRKLGAVVETGRDWISVAPPPSGPAVPPSASAAPSPPISIATYDDHRMAMAFAVAGLRMPGIRIENPACTAKTYPDFFRDLAALSD